MKSIFAGTSLAATFAAIGVGAGLMVPTQVEAAIHPTINNRIVEFNGKQISRVPSFAYGGTTYMPIWYVMQALKQVGVQSTWSTGRWDMTTSLPANFLVSEIPPSSGSKTIAINSKVVQHVNSIAVRPPGAKVATTFMPIWYVMRVLDYVNVNSTWNGQVWNLTQTTAATKGQVTEALLQGLGVSPWAAGTSIVQSPGDLTQKAATFDDVQPTDPNWGYVQADVNWLYASRYLEDIEPILPPDSSAHYGLSDSVSWVSLDKAYESHVHVGALPPGNVPSTFPSVPPSYSPGPDFSYYEPGHNSTDDANQPIRWANAVGLMYGIPQREYVTVADLPTLVKNVRALTQGYKLLSKNDYQIQLPPMDEYFNSYAWTKWSTPGYGVLDIMDVYRRLNNSQVRVVTGKPIASIDMLTPSTSVLSVTASSLNGSPVQFSWDYGRTWHELPKFDSGNYAAGGLSPATGTPGRWGPLSKYVELKPASGAGLAVQVLTDGSSYATLDINVLSNGSLSVHRPDLTVPTSSSLTPALRPWAAMGQTNANGTPGESVPGEFLVTYTQPLYVGGRALTDGENVTSDFSYSGKGALVSAIYHITNQTSSITFTLSAPQNGDRVLTHQNTLTSAAGVATLPNVYTYYGTVGVWDSNN